MSPCQNFLSGVKGPLLGCQFESQNAIKKAATAVTYHLHKGDY
jgi:hypothetical protein